MTSHARRIWVAMLTAALPVLMIPAARGDTPKDAPQSGPIEVKLHGTAQAEGGLALRFDAVTDDSRCPADVECMWAGQATIRIEVEKDGKKESIQLSTNASASASPSGTALGHEVTLVQLRPERFTSQDKGKNYEAVLSVKPATK